MELQLRLSLEGALNALRIVGLNKISFSDLRSCESGVFCYKVHISLITDYNAKLEKPTKRVISEVMHDTAPRHDFKKQSELHEKIRNDDDYDDWSYGTEPNYGNPWK